MTTVSYPVMAAPKLFGIDCLIVNGHVLTRHAHPLPNRSVSSMLQGLPSFSGTLVIGDPRSPDCLRRSHEGIMEPEGFPNFVLWVYDMMTHGSYPFAERIEIAKHMVNACSKNIQMVNYELIKSHTALERYRKLVLNEGYSDIMLYDPAERQFQTSIEGLKT